MTHSQSEKIAEDQSDEKLQKMTELFHSVQNFGSNMGSSVKTKEIQMRQGFEKERFRRKEDYKHLEKKMAAKMEEGFKKEQHAIQQVQNEMVQGFKKRRKRKTAGSRRAGSHKRRDQQHKNGKWQCCLQRGQHWCGIGVWYFCAATSTLLSME